MLEAASYTSIITPTMKDYADSVIFTCTIFNMLASLFLIPLFYFLIINYRLYKDSKLYKPKHPLLKILLIIFLFFMFTVQMKLTCFLILNTIIIKSTKKITIPLTLSYIAIIIILLLNTTLAICILYMHQMIYYKKKYKLQKRILLFSIISIMYIFTPPLINTVIPIPYFMCVFTAVPLGYIPFMKKTKTNYMIILITSILEIILGIALRFLMDENGILGIKYPIDLISSEQFFNTFTLIYMTCLITHIVLHIKTFNHLSKRRQI